MRHFNMSNLKSSETKSFDDNLIALVPLIVMREFSKHREDTLHRTQLMTSDSENFAQFSSINGYSHLKVVILLNFNVQHLLQALVINEAYCSYVIVMFAQPNKQHK